jgi:hypothetical protein
MKPTIYPQLSTDFLHRAQGGFALPLALVMLLIMTLLSVSAMGTANLQLLMAGNSQQQMQALMRAENALAEGQNHVVFNIKSPSSEAPTEKGGGYYRFDVVGTHPAVDSDAFWQNSENTRPPVDAHSKYVVEYLANRPASSESLAVGSGPGASQPTRNIYRVVARAESDRGGLRVLQNYVITEEPPK